MASLPFEIYDNKGRTVTGLAYLEEEEFVVFEIQVRKWSLYKMPLVTVKAEFAVVDNIRLQGVPDVEVKKGLRNRQIVLRPKSLSMFEAVPGTQGDRLALRIARKDWPEAERLASHVRLERSELRLEELDEGPDA